MKPLSLYLLFSFVFLSGSLAGVLDQFETPPDSARPGVYWYFMDGNQNRTEMVRDLEAMKGAGLGNLIFLEVNIGVPRGPIDFMSEQWQDNFAFAVRNAERLGLDITLGIGPGWSGSGGPWVKDEEAMQHLVYSSVDVEGPGLVDVTLQVPEQHIEKYHEMKSEYYKDVITFAVPRVEAMIGDVEEKAFYSRKPYTLSRNTERAYIPMASDFTDFPKEAVIAPDSIIDLSGRLDDQGRLRWHAPVGEWTIIRMASRPTGANSRPAPKPAAGFEHDKLSKVALENHFESYYGTLMKKVGPRKGPHGWTTVHLDSWEMGAQNWTPGIAEEFKKRFDYDPTPYLVTFTGRVVDSLEKSERFLFDWRSLCNDMLLENYIGHLKYLGNKNGFTFSQEPYAQAPTNDISMGAIADIPMCEFWLNGESDTIYGCLEATSAAHIMGKPIVAAESFTARRPDFRYHPWALKNQSDWALAFGINRFVYHTFAHKPLGDDVEPGMTMGRYGLNWDRKRVWWPMVNAYHDYITRSSHILRQGLSVSDILYLTPEGSPVIFTPPWSAFHDKGAIRDKKGYSFDGCSPLLLDRAMVRDGMIAFPGGSSSYKILVLPDSETMRPETLDKVIELVEAGAVVMGNPPRKSPSLLGYPEVDSLVRQKATRLWGGLEVPVGIQSRNVGEGTVYFGANLSPAPVLLELGSQRGKLENPRVIPTYPEYEVTARILGELGVSEDFTASPDLVRYKHRRTEDSEIYFVSNRENRRVEVECSFRVREGIPSLMDPVTGEVRLLPEFTTGDGMIKVPMVFEAHQSYFVVFSESTAKPGTVVNFPRKTPLLTLEGPWDVTFEAKRGGPETDVTFDALHDWTESHQPGIKYYSGIGLYKKTFEVSGIEGSSQFLNLGEVHDMARVTLNGKNLGVVWCAPWSIEITDALKVGVNELSIEVANSWNNRLVGDANAPDKSVRSVQFGDGFLEGKAFDAGRYTFTINEIPADRALQPSGLIGPVQVTVSE